MAWTAPRTWTTGEVVTASIMNTHVRDNMREVWRELAYVEFTAAVTPSVGSFTDVVTSGSITYTAEPIMVEFYSPKVDLLDNGEILVALFEGTTQLGNVLRAQGNSSSGAAHGDTSGYGARRLTPTAGSREYKFRGYNVSGSNVIQAGAGTSSNYMPGYIRIFQKGTT